MEEQVRERKCTKGKHSKPLTHKSHNNERNENSIHTIKSKKT
jgi:hypothetical protein